MSARLLPTLLLLLVALCVAAVPSIAQSSSRARVLVVVTSNDKMKNGTPGGYFFPELLDFYARLYYSDNYRADDFTIISPKGGKAPMYNRSGMANVISAMMQIDEAEGNKMMQKLDNTLTPDQVDPASFDVIYYVGGYACLFDYPKNEKIASIATTIYERGGIIAAICHGPSALLPIKLSNGQPLLQGLTVTARTFDEESDYGQLTRQQILGVLPFIISDSLPGSGASYIAQTAFEPHVVVSGRVVTGQNEYSGIDLADSVLVLFSRGSAGVRSGRSASGLSLEQSVPNPAYDATTLRFTLPTPAHVRLVLRNMLGQEVATIVDGERESGSHAVTLATADLPAGVYICTLETAKESVQQTVVVVK